MRTGWLCLLSALWTPSFAQCDLTGVVLAGKSPVAFASVAVAGTGAGSAADAAGRFRIPGVPCSRVRINVTAVGFAPRTLDAQGGEALTIQLMTVASELEEVVVTGTLREVSRADSPLPIEVITPRLFQRNPAPALFDAVAQVNGVRPQINCSVCGTGDIHINGMEGPYTMVLIDGMPIVSGLSTVYGLSGIPISLIERVEVAKGPGSALYGSEAMGGIINVVTKDPSIAPRLSAELMTTGWAEHSADVGMRMGNGAASGLLGVNTYWYELPHDGNEDGFTDLALQKRASVFNKWGFRRVEQRRASLAGRYVHEDRWGGQMDWTPDHAGSDSIYGESIGTRRWELIGQYELPLKERVMAQLSWNRHQQRSWYGVKPFNALQTVLFAQLHWSHRFAERHEVLCGAAFRRTDYQDDTPAVLGGGVARGRRDLPGIFFQDEWTLNEANVLLGGYRADWDHDHGVVHSPRLAWKYAPSGRFAVRTGFGTGYRVVNLFTEEHAALTGARTVVVSEDLLPERSWNGTLTVTRRWPGERRALTLDASAFLTRFGNRILPDYDSDPDLIIYRNLNGYGLSRGISLNLEGRSGSHWRAMTGATWMLSDVFEGDAREQQFLAPRWSGTFMLAYERKGGMILDLNGQWYGPMRLPVQPNDFRPAASPWHALLNMQVRQRLPRGIEIFAGCKNLLDFVPRDPIMRPFDPFDRRADDAGSNPQGYTFDTSYMYAPMQGRRWFAGVRCSLD